MTKTHWLYGRGPEKLLEFAREVDVETDCARCSHNKVCAHRMEERCENFSFGTSQYSGCGACIHKYTRYDKDNVPCFSCPDFAPVLDGDTP